MKASTPSHILYLRAFILRHLLYSIRTFILFLSLTAFQTIIASYSLDVIGTIYMLSVMDSLFIRCIR